MNQNANNFTVEDGLPPLGDPFGSSPRENEHTINTTSSNEFNQLGNPQQSLAAGTGAVSNSAIASMSTSASSDEGGTFDAEPDGEPRQFAKQLFARARARIERRLHSSALNDNKERDGSDSDFMDFNFGSLGFYRYGNSTGSNFPYEEPICVLPPEVLCLIFSYMNSKTDLLNIALVCKAWAEMIIELIWFRPGISDENVYAKLGVVLEQPKSSTYWNYRMYIKRLNLSLVPNLVTDKYLSLFQGCKNLERITLVNCSHVGSAAITGLLKDCNRLQSIDLTGVRDIQDDIYHSLAANCLKLQGLYIPGSFDVTKGAILEVIRSCPLLKRLKISECPEVDDEILTELVAHCPNLVEIDLHGCGKVTNTAVHEMFVKLENLKEFKISKNDNITSVCFDDSPDGSRLCLEKLRILDFTQCSNITDSAVEKFTMLAPRLRNVVLSKCTAITDRALHAIAKLGKNLHYVHLGHCSNITDYGACELIKCCYRLQYIDLACCTQLTNATVVELAQLPKLKRIGLVKCSQITDEGILALAENSRSHEDNLERVHLSYCMNLTIYPIYRLLKAFPRLTHISLTGVAQFLRRDITQFCREPPEEFNPHQKSIFCVFSGEGVNQLRTYLTQLIETPQDPHRETDELLDIINSVTEGVGSVDDTMLNSNPLQRNRLRVFVGTLNRFINEFHHMNVPREKLELFAKCIFIRLEASQVPRIERFFQLLQSHPIRIVPVSPRSETLAREERRRQLLQQQQLQQQQQVMQQRELQRRNMQATAEAIGRRNLIQGDSGDHRNLGDANGSDLTRRQRSSSTRRYVAAIRRAPVEAELFQRQQYQQRQFEERQLREQRERRARAQGARFMDPDVPMDQ